jgi:hypothetical protein
MKLIVHQPAKYHMADDTIHEFEKVILADPQIQQVQPFNRNLSKISFYQWRILKRFGLKQNPFSFWNVVKRESETAQGYFTILMGFYIEQYLKCLPYFMLPVRKSIYMFDAWPGAHEIIRQFVKFFEVDHVFLSSSQATDRLKNTAGKSKFYWIPEGINPEEYKYFSYQKKDIDVLAFGRQFDEYHEKIKNPIESDHKVYVYPKSLGEDLFPVFSNRDEFITGLARSKISICFPSSITNPKRSGDIHTMTIRYLQSMVSKCLLVGHAPEEMVTFFGYNPVVEVDMYDPVSQIREILNNYSNYVSLIEKNFNIVIKSHTWCHRWLMIKDILNWN